MSVSALLGKICCHLATLSVGGSCSINTEIKLLNLAELDRTLVHQRRSNMVNESDKNGVQTRGSLYHYKNPLTQQEVETIVEKSLGPKYRIINYYVRVYSNENLGFMGAHRNFVVEVSPEGSTVKEIYTYFLKSVPYNVDGQAKFVEDSRMFYKETSFYSFIMPELMKNSKDKSWAPQCYLVKKDSLVFENLQAKNYMLRDKFLDVPSLKSALSSLAKMHAASLLAEKRLGKTFIEMYPHLMDEILFSRDGPFAGWYRAGVDVVIKVAEKLGLNCDVVSKMCDLSLVKILPSKTRRNVVNHGDAWSNNFMFNGSKCALVDFQLMRYVPPMTDVVQAIYHNATRELRNLHEVELLKHYHEAVCEALMNGGVDLPKFQDLLEEYEEMRIIGIVMINLYYQINHIDGEKRVELMKDTEGFNSLLFQDRRDLVLEMMEKDERYRKLVESGVRELVEASSKYF